MASPAPISKTEPKGNPVCRQYSFIMPTAVSFCHGSRKPQLTTTDTVGFGETGDFSSAFKNWSSVTGMASAYRGKTKSTSENPAIAWHSLSGSSFMISKYSVSAVASFRNSSAYSFELERGARGLPFKIMIFAMQAPRFSPRLPAPLPMRILPGAFQSTYFSHYAQLGGKKLLFPRQTGSHIR